MTEPDSPTAPEWRNFYGRRHGKTLRPAQRAALDHDLAHLSPGPVTRNENPARTLLDLTTRFGPRPVWLEIGFGGGEHMVHQATLHPDIAIIGAEPFVNGVAMLLRKIADARATNIAIHPGDARDLIEVLPTGSITRAFLNYPDPWPKRRHHRRRFVTPDHLIPLARVMAPGSQLRIASDIPSYIDQALAEVPPAGFDRLDHDTARPWDDWVTTRYEAKALREGRTPAYLTFLRR